MKRKWSSFLAVLGVVFSPIVIDSSNAMISFGMGPTDCEACHQLQQLDNQPQFPSAFFSSSLLNQNLYSMSNGFTLGYGVMYGKTTASVAAPKIEAPRLMPASFTYQPAFSGPGYVTGFPQDFHPF